MSLWIALCGVSVLLAVATGAVSGEYLRRREDIERTGVLLWGGLALCYFVLTVALMLCPVPGVAAIPAAATAFCGWCAIQFWRRRKDRKPSRILGVVRNLGHRLAVVPVPGGSR